MAATMPTAISSRDRPNQAPTRSPSPDIARTVAGYAAGTISSIGPWSSIPTTPRPIAVAAIVMPNRCDRSFARGGGGGGGGTREPCGGGAGGGGGRREPWGGGPPADPDSAGRCHQARDAGGTAALVSLGQSVDRS